MSPEVCTMHEREVATIHDVDTKIEKVGTDVRWILRISSAVGAFVLVLVPLMITCLVWVFNIDKRLAIVEQEVFPIVKR